MYINLVVTYMYFLFLFFNDVNSIGHTICTYSDSCCDVKCVLYFFRRYLSVISTGLPSTKLFVNPLLAVFKEKAIHIYNYMGCHVYC